MKHTTLFIHLSLLFQLAAVAKPYKILSIFLTPFYSHFIPVAPILEELIHRGHQLVVISPYKFNVEPQWSKNIDVIQLSELQPIADDITKQMDFSGQFDPSRPLKNHELFTQMAILKLKVLRERVWDVITKQEYDAVFVEDMGGSYYYKLADYLNCSYIGFSPQDQAGETALGNGLHLILHPMNDDLATMYGFDGAKSFVDRFMCCLRTIVNAVHYFPHRSKTNRVMDSTLYGEDLQNFNSTRKRPDLQIKAVHTALGYHRAMLANTVQIGFPHIKPQKKLPEELEEILNSSKNGVIYVSFGSIINSATTKQAGIFDIEVFKSALARLQYDVIWKWDTLEMEGKPGNVQLVKWVPQQDIIAHDKVKLVICHGGLQTIVEAIYSEKPLLAIPFIWDHHANSQRVERLGIGRMMNRVGMVEEELVSAISDLMSNQR